MGVYYDLYSEVLVADKWVNIDSYVLGLDGEYHHCPTISGQSYLRDAIDKLSKYSYCLSFDELSEGTRSDLLSDNSDEYNREVKTRKFEAFDFQTAIKDQLRGAPIMRGFVDRHYIAAFQRRDIDSIEEWLTAADYANLDKPEQQAYSYYEWDDREGWYAIFKSLAARIEVLVELQQLWNTGHGLYKCKSEGCPGSYLRELILLQLNTPHIWITSPDRLAAL